MSNAHMRTVGFDEAERILADDTSPKGQTFLQRHGSKDWQIVLPGEHFFITAETFKKLANEHVITAGPSGTNYFVPSKQ
jgi:uncharacterized protein YaiE (UPF0345 family)